MSRRPLHLVPLALALALAPAIAHADVLPSGARTARAEAQGLSDAFVHVADGVGPSVVQIEVRQEPEEDDAHVVPVSGGDDAPMARAMGSGVVFTPDGAILTNNHVVEGAVTIDVRLHDGRVMPALFVGRDPATDLAVIKVDAKGLAPVRFADSDGARVGQWVVAIGSPYGLGYTVTTGVLSAKDRGGFGMNAIEDYLQTDASINPGNSGGPLCDLDGQVLGINAMVLGHGSGIGFAIPARIARRVAEQILGSGRVERASLGVGVQDLTPDLASAMHVASAHGALVNAVRTGGPAQQANIQAGDVITSLGGHPIRDGHDLVSETLGHDVGQTVDVAILREGRPYSVRVKLAERPEEPVPPLPMQQRSAPRSGFGLRLSDIAADRVERAGLGAHALTVVEDVDAGSCADRAGLKRGDLIVEAGGVHDPTSAEIQREARGGSLLLRLRRRDSFFYAAIRRPVTGA